MKLSIEAACGCHTGKIRSNNEDNFFFDGRCLELENNGLRNVECLALPLSAGTCFAVFDGMGGEDFGEAASFAAARTLQQTTRSIADFFVSGRRFLERLVGQMNDAVVKRGRELGTDRMGTTFVALYFASRYAYICNLGDSRAYRLRSGQFLQLSHDHTDARPMGSEKKPALSQYLGIDPEEMRLVPSIAKGELARGDRYLLASDGLTDMLSNLEIAAILMANEDAGDCAEALIQAALARGGRDNTTVIVLKVT